MTGALCLVAAMCLVLGHFLGWLHRGHFDRQNPGGVPAPLCLGSLCDAFRSPACQDGRCRFHCRLHCKCEERPAPETAESPTRGTRH